MEDNLTKEITKLRQLFKENPFLKLEFVAMLSRLLREHDVSVTPTLLSNIQLAISSEIPPNDISTMIDPDDHEPAIDPFRPE